jgi:hypothetical protein
MPNANGGRPIVAPRSRSVGGRARYWAGAGTLKMCFFSGMWQVAQVAPSGTVVYFECVRSACAAWHSVHSSGTGLRSWLGSVSLIS